MIGEKKRGQSGIDKASPQGAAEVGFISEEGGETEEAGGGGQAGGCVLVFQGERRRPLTRLKRIKKSGKQCGALT